MCRFFFFYFPRHLLQDCASYFNSSQQNVLLCSWDKPSFPAHLYTRAQKVATQQSKILQIEKTSLKNTAKFLCQLHVQFISVLY